MHELSITQSMLDIVLDHARRHAAQKVVKVRVVIGKMSGVAVESVRFCFEAVTKETLAEGAALEIEEVPYAGKCAECSTAFEIQDYTLACPRCSSTDIEITGGRELYVKDFEAD